MSQAEINRLEELLAGQVLGDLSADEQFELELLLDNEEDPSDTIAELEQTLARVQLAYSSDYVDDSEFDSLPRALRERIQVDAPQYLNHAVQAETPAVEPWDSSPQASKQSSFSVRESIAWLAAAAAILIAVSLWNFDDGGGSFRTAAGQRSALIASASDLIRVNWGDGPTPFGDKVTGDVVWSTQLQEGYMRFVGVPINDATKLQYQLWIIDPKRDAEPIDGGVFDVSSDGEVIIPINAKLKVLDPQAFAITVEQPGGVVVSTQENLPLLAAVTP